MFTVWTCTLLLICGCHVASSADCPYKECGCFGSSISCRGRGLISVPVCNCSQATGYRTLALDSNNITEISAGSLPTGLTEISLFNNPITTIDDNAFDQLSTTLETLYFTNARLARIPDAFLHLDSLHSLTIISTPVLDWNADAMAHIGETLQTLNLEQVGLTTWPDWLTNFEHLNELNLAGNAISSIPDNAFDKMSNSLLALTLSNNNMKASPKALSNLKNLTSLDIQNNILANITWLPLSVKLSSLTLNQNHLSDADQLGSVLHSYADSLESLALSFNQLTAIPDVSFLTHLEFVDLSHNLISEPNSGTLHNTVGEIDLSFNLFPSIPTIYSSLDSVFMMFLSNNVIHIVQGEHIPTWVTNLDLQYNLITELNDSSFPENSTLQDLTLDNNPLLTISNLAFKNLGLLNILSLQNTKLTRLPLSLVYLTSISYIALNNNTDLVCTCTEKSVDTIALYVDLNSNCGDISIYNFLANLSPSCP